MESNIDVMVVGGGLGGLASAVLLARAGRRVALHERAAALGGRAATSDEARARLNLGGHALYRAGFGIALLRELGVDPAGRQPPASGRLALDGGRLHALPSGFASLLSTTLLGPGEKLEAGRLLQGIGDIDARGLRGQTVSAWIERAARRAGTRRLLHALVRLATYANAPDLADAGDAVAQVQLALSGGVLYVDGGWQTIVDALRARAVQLGVAIHAASRAVRVEPGRVELAGGGRVSARAVVLAVGPAAARALVPASAAVAAAADAAVAVRAACLDLVLSSLPRPRATFCLGVDEPLYYSVHTAAAALAEDGAQVVHTARYLAPGEQADASSLEGLLDRLQPGWRGRVLARRFLPRLVVANDVAPAGRRRPGPVIPDAPGVFLVGDWIGHGAMLSDASLASARAAAQQILGDERGAQRPRTRRAVAEAEAPCS